MRFLALLIGFASIGCSLSVTVPLGTFNRECISNSSTLIAISLCHLDVNGFIARKLSYDDMTNTTNLQRFTKTCSAADKCLTSLSHCHMFGKERTPIFENLVKTTCDFAIYMANSSCSEKLKHHEEECRESWNPFLDVKELQDESKKKEKCQNFFGKDGCVKDVMVKWCGKQEWVQYRDHMLKLNNLVFKQCELNVDDWN